ncbi:hypothetical protein SUDANB95_05041 [Actinosynnema sp. ALI-1.44]
MTDKRSPEFHPGWRPCVAFPTNRGLSAMYSLVGTAPLT